MAKESCKIGFVTELTKKLGISVPIIQGGMMHVGTADLASAVSNAGGLGLVTALKFRPEHKLRDEIRRCRTIPTCKALITRMEKEAQEATRLL